MRYVVTDLGPLDWKPAGTDVTGDYDAKTLKELLKYKIVAKVDDAPGTEPDPVEEGDDGTNEG